MNIENINFFIQSDKIVGGFSIYNMNRININFDNKVTKFIIFKKNKISSIEHLDYLWLVRCKQNKPNQNIMLINRDLGLIYHQTLNRNKFNNIIKFIFYICLYFHSQHENKSILCDYKLDNLLEIITTNELLDIFYHSTQDLIGIPANDKIWSLKNDVLINLYKYKNNHQDAYFKNNSIALLNINFFCYLDLILNNFNEIIITFENVKSINLNLYEINYNEKIIINSYYFDVDNNNIIIKNNFIKKQNYINIAMMFCCNNSIDENVIYKIKAVSFN
jgi:hypothetical protein